MVMHRYAASAALALFALSCGGDASPTGFGSHTDAGTGSTPTPTPKQDAGTPGPGKSDAGPVPVPHPGSQDAGPAPVIDAGPICAPNPGNYDIPGNGCDDDGDGTVDNVPGCDTSLPLTGTAGQFAQAIDLCAGATPAVATGPTDTHWGVISAIYTSSFTNNASAPAAGQWGIMPKYGTAITPYIGKSLGVLSSGFAREFDDATLTSCNIACADGTATGSCGTSNFGNYGCFKYGQTMNKSGGSAAPPGFPQTTTGCPSVAGEPVNDLIDVKLQIKVPLNAQGFSFNFNFLSGEWPDFVCSTYNDSFIAYLTSSAANGGKPGNISFDANKNPINVNTNFFNECTPGTPLGCSGSLLGGGGSGTSVCTDGVTGLAGTGFAPVGTFCTNPSTAGGATGWLTSQSPVTPGEVITIEFMIWDTLDSAYDSSVILDAFTWQPTPVQIGTQPAPPPPPPQFIRL